MNADATSIYADKFYEMDPEHDDLLPTGADLRDGMVVLIEDSILRVDLASTQADNCYDMDRAKEMNRWCVVSLVKVTPRYESAGLFGSGPTREMSPLVSFIAEYPDGTKRKRQFDASYAWLVKRDSIGGAA